MSYLVSGIPISLIYIFGILILVRNLIGGNCLFCINANVPTRPNPTASSMGGPGTDPTDPGTQQSSANLSPSTDAPTPNKRGGAPIPTTRSSKEEKVQEENGEGDGE